MGEKRVVIAGSEGVVGKVLTGHTIAEDGQKPSLDAEITRVDARPPRGSDEAADLGEAYNRPEYHDTTNGFELADLSDDATIERLLRTHDTWVHAAWAADGILSPDKHNPNNLELVKRVLRVAAGMGATAAPKIVLLSSVNAHVPQDWRERQARGELIDADEPATPHHHNRGGQPGPGNTRYGESKVEMEALAEEYARDHGLDITVLRLGGVNLKDALPSTYPPYVNIEGDDERGKHFDLAWEDAVRLGHDDLVEAVQAVVNRERKVGNFVRVNLVSDHPDRVHKLPSDSDQR